MNSLAATGHRFIGMKFLPGLALSLSMLLLRGLSFYTLAWSCLACGLLWSRQPSRTGGLSWFLAALSALMGNSPGGMMSLAVACILEIILCSDIRERAIPFISLLLLSSAGMLTGLTFVLLGCAVALVLDCRYLRSGLCGLFLLAGVLIHGPPSSVMTGQWSTERLAKQWLRYDWHQPIQVTRCNPKVMIYYPTPPDRQFVLNVSASFSSESASGGWIQQGDTYHFLDTATDSVLLRGHEPFSVVLPGEWRPFSPDRISINVKCEI